MIEGRDIVLKATESLTQFFKQRAAIPVQQPLDHASMSHYPAFEFVGRALKSRGSVVVHASPL